MVEPHFRADCPDAPWGQAAPTARPRAADLVAPAEHIALLREPSQFDSLRRKDHVLSEGVASICGMDQERMETLAFCFQAATFTQTQAAQWLTEQGLEPQVIGTAAAICLPAWFQAPFIAQTGNNAILVFTHLEARDEANILARELAYLTFDRAGLHLTLDFNNVTYVNSVELGTLIKLHKEMQSKGGKLALLNVSPEVFEVFAITKLSTLLSIVGR